MNSRTTTRIKRTCGLALAATALLTGALAGPANAADTKEKGGDVSITGLGFVGGGYSTLYFDNTSSSFCTEIHWDVNEGGLQYQRMAYIKPYSFRGVDSGYDYGTGDDHRYKYVSGSWYWVRTDLGSYC